MMKSAALSFWPSAAAPFGPLQALHEHIITTAQPVTLQTDHHILFYPLAPLFLQAYLLQYEHTRRYRIPLGICSLYFVFAAWSGYRFYEPWLNAGNNLLGVMFLHFIGKAVEFALLEEPVIDPFAAKGRGGLMCAYDLCANSRWIGLRPVAVEPKAPKPVQASDSAASSSRSHTAAIAQPEARWLPKPPFLRTRRQAFVRHLRLACTYLLTLDALLHLLRHFGSDTVALSHVPLGGVDKFYNQPFILLPRTPYATRTPQWVVDLAIKAFLGSGVYTMLIGGYHLAATLNVGLGLYEVEAWETDLFDNPVGTDSVLEFWGRGWHQVFRHHFNLLSVLIVKYLHLPRLFLLPVAFGLSGALHALGQISMSPSPSPSALFLFFMVQSLGCLAEILFNRVTGRRVRGWLGWAWKNAFLALTSTLAVKTELESGLGGTVLMPDLGGGRFIARLITRYIVDRP